MKNGMRLVAWTATLAVLTLVVAVPGTTEGSKEGAGSGAAPVTLVVWDTFTTDSDVKLMDKFVKDYEKAHPGVRVERRVTSPADMRQTVKLALSSDTAPDIFYYDAGPAFGEVLAKAGLIEYIDEVYAQKGWDKTVAQGPRDQVVLKGKTYGIPNEVEYHAAFYNVDMFKTMGLKEPKTWDEFEAICQKLADKKLVSWPWGDRKGIWYTWIQAPFFESVAGGPKVLQALRGELAWNSPDFVKAVEVMKQFYEKKYFNQDFASLDSPEVRMMFYNEQAGMMPRGSWEKKRLDEGRRDGTVKFNYDHFQIPPYKPGINATAPGGIGSAWFVAANAKHKKEAFDFLALTLTDEASVEWLRAGYIPALKLSDSVFTQANLDPIMTKLVRGAATMHTGATNVYLPGNVNEYLFHNAPRAWKGEISPQELQDNFQRLYVEYLKAGVS